MFNQVTSTSSGHEELFLSHLPKGK
jgi:hypothetical protein